MEFNDIIFSRKSIRNYTEQAVEPEKLTKILEAARAAPSWANKQCCQYVVVSDKAKIKEFSSIINPWLKQAPVLIVACADPKDSGSRNGMDYFLVDVAISLQQLILAATDLGLGTCWIGGFSEEKVKKVLEIPNNIKVVALTPIGYAAESNLRTKIARKIIRSDKRKPLEEIVHKEKW